MNKESFLIISLARSDKKVFTIEVAKAIAGEKVIKLLIYFVRKKWTLRTFKIVFNTEDLKWKLKFKYILSGSIRF